VVTLTISIRIKIPPVLGVSKKFLELYCKDVDYGL